MSHINFICEIAHAYKYACILSLHYTKPCISTNTHKNMSPDDGTVATPHERPPLLRGHFHTTFRVAAGEGFYCIRITDEKNMTPLQVSCWRGKFLRRTQEWYSFNYYLYTIEQWALRTWVWCSYGFTLSMLSDPSVFLGPSVRLSVRQTACPYVCRPIHVHSIITSTILATIISSGGGQCTRKTFMIHQTFVRWA